MAKPTLLRLVITPSQISLDTGASHQFTVVGVWRGGQTKPVVVTWTATGGTMTSGGLYTAGAVEGTYAVRATKGVLRAEVFVKLFIRKTHTVYGPTSSITQPGGATLVSAGANTIKTASDAAAAGTTFWIQNNGTYTANASIDVKAGNIYVFEYGVTVDCSAWATADVTQSLFRATGATTNVTIKNGTISAPPQRGIYGAASATGWLIHHMAITGADAATAISAPGSSIVEYCRFYDNPYGSYSAYDCDNVTWQYNEFTGNGSEQKMVATDNGRFLNNWFHDETRHAIWYDADNTNWLVDNNLIEDCGDPSIADGDGVFIEISGVGIARNNTIRRCCGHGIFISTSRQGEYSNNVVENCFRGIQLQLTVAAIGGGSIGWDLADNAIHGNTVTCPATADLGSLGLPTANGQAYCCTASQVGGQSVRVATTANITLSGAQTIDGISIASPDRVRVKNQTAGENNGIWVAAAGAWARATDADTSAEVTSGMYVKVVEGTVNANTGWQLTTAAPITLGTTVLVFAAFDPNPAYFATTHTKNNIFDTNTYHLPSNGTTPRWFFWPNAAGANTGQNFTEWKTFQHDAGTTVIVP